jgi:predicted GIY-YIG superfamily endonuclease
MIRIQRQFHNSSFVELIPSFTSLLTEWKPLENNFPIKDYFGTGLGKVGALSALKESGLIADKKDFRGIYVFIKSGIPFYVGISQNVIGRILQHVKGSSHFTSSLCYKLGTIKHLEEMGKKHDGGRKGLDFMKYAEPAKKELITCNIATLPIKNDLELYLFEVYVSMELGTLYYNEFKTH